MAKLGISYAEPADRKSGRRPSRVLQLLWTLFCWFCAFGSVIAMSALMAARAR
jgi:hypothetical protein